MFLSRFRVSGLEIRALGLGFRVSGNERLSKLMFNAGAAGGAGLPLMQKALNPKQLNQETPNPISPISPITPINPINPTIHEPHEITKPWNSEPLELN